MAGSFAGDAGLMDSHSLQQNLPVRWRGTKRLRLAPLNGLEHEKVTTMYMMYFLKHSEISCYGQQLGDITTVVDDSYWVIKT